jgi:hypothetical protein
MTVAIVLVPERLTISRRPGGSSPVEGPRDGTVIETSGCERLIDAYLASTDASLRHCSPRQSTPFDGNERLELQVNRYHAHPSSGRGNPVIAQPRQSAPCAAGWVRQNRRDDHLRTPRHRRRQQHPGFPALCSARPNRHPRRTHPAPTYVGLADRAIRHIGLCTVRADLITQSHHRAMARTYVSSVARSPFHGAGFGR